MIPMKRELLGVKSCTAECHLKGYPFAALQDAKFCMCTRKYGRYGVADDDTQCRRQCLAGSPDEKCGGPWKNAVYKIGKFSERFFGFLSFNFIHCTRFSLLNDAWHISNPRSQWTFQIIADKNISSFLADYPGISNKQAIIQTFLVSLITWLTFPVLILLKIVALHFPFKIKLNDMVQLRRLGSLLVSWLKGHHKLGSFNCDTFLSLFRWKEINEQFYLTEWFLFCFIFLRAVHTPLMIQHNTHKNVRYTINLIRLL